MDTPLPVVRSSLRIVLASARADKAAGPVEELAESLAEEMADAWRQGTPRLAEKFLTAHPEIAHHPTAAVRLIYEEMCLREEAGQSICSVEVIGRFPQWRTELEGLLCCFRLLHRRGAEPSFPEVGEVLGDFRLLSELGRGGMGRVFLAVQPALAERPVVLKLTPRVGEEHLSLARLQHTHIVPLYWVQDFAERGLRGLCMPYLGGDTLDHILAGLRSEPAPRRTGSQLQRALEQARAGSPVPCTAQGPALAFFKRATYTDAITWLAACTADALQYAHERGLVHLDLKPANLLLAADGQPMVLDFHLARRPLQPGESCGEWLGGTPQYMAPEQEAALLALCDGRSVPAAVDCRADIYSLGLVLYAALGGPVPLPSDGRQPRLEQFNPQVSTGLADIVHRCLAPDPAQRYQQAAALAGDLHRQQNHQPLRGVANRDWRERARKWRRRHPHGIGILALLALVLSAAALAGFAAWRTTDRPERDAEIALTDGRQQMHRRQYAEAARSFERGLALLEDGSGSDKLRLVLADHLHNAQRAEAAQRLHLVADHLRFGYGIDAVPRPQLLDLETRSRQVWQWWSTGERRTEASLDADIERQIHADILDLAILRADLHIRSADQAEIDRARHEAMQILAEAENAFGPSIVLCTERQAQAEALGMKDSALESAQRAETMKPRSAWEHYALGRTHLRLGRTAQAAAEFDIALELEPQDFWPNFYRGVCAYRMEAYPDAVAAFCTCVALAPQRAECYFNRALAYSKLGKNEQAVKDYDRALRMDAKLVSALVNRGMLHYRLEQYSRARIDLSRALEQGADPATVTYDLALVSLAEKDPKTARELLQQAVAHDPRHESARNLLERLERKH
jgi:serine/threonine protein kinase/Flp pilus assembly protein TadD